MADNNGSTAGEQRRPPEESKAQQQPPPPRKNRKRKNKEVAIFGNYRNYYGYRIGQELEEDPRLKVMKKEWFEGKDCLDIGCNSGLITITIAKKFCCRSILGLDIDGDRIVDAYWTCRKIGKQVGDLFDNVSFKKGNFIDKRCPVEDKFYHTILCLSVSKWIHLNWGDEGLIKLFAKIWRLLHPGGLLVLEPQPWDSYNKNRLVSETAADNYKNIGIYPADFQDILLDKIGFRMVENLTASLSGTKSGFQRPILAFWK